MNDLTKEAIEKIEQLVERGLTPAIIEIDGKKYTKSSLQEVARKKYLDCIRTSSLNSLIDFVKDTLKSSNGKYLLHVESMNEVYFYEPVDNEQHRNCIMIASISDSVERFTNKYIDPEEMIINLKRFSDTYKDFDKVLTVAGGISNKSEVSITDDGIGQTTTLVQGSNVITNVEIRNTVEINFKRSFKELDYLSETFVLRVKDGRVSLFTGESDSYKYDYIAAIKDYLLYALVEYLNKDRLLII